MKLPTTYQIEQDTNHEELNMIKDLDNIIIHASATIQSHISSHLTNNNVHQNSSGGSNNNMMCDGMNEDILHVIEDVLNEIIDNIELLSISNGDNTYNTNVTNDTKLTTSSEEVIQNTSSNNERYSDVDYISDQQVFNNTGDTDTNNMKFNDSSLQEFLQSNNWSTYGVDVNKISNHNDNSKSGNSNNHNHTIEYVSDINLLSKYQNNNTLNNNSNTNSDNVLQFKDSNVISSTSIHNNSSNNNHSLQYMDETISTASMNDFEGDINDFLAKDNADDNNVNDNVILREGFLHKRGFVNTAFRRRWCVLRGHYITFYKHYGDSNARGIIDIRECSCEYNTELDQLYVPFIFIIHTPYDNNHSKWIFQTASNDERLGWITAIEIGAWSITHSHMDNNLNNSNSSNSRSRRRTNTQSSKIESNTASDDCIII
jgi:hypothetical protein